MKRAPLIIALFMASALQAAKPNIIFILADDMGYGDVQALNPKSKLPTPHLNRLAKEGMTFTDAHSPSGVCTPTRYGVITGRYCWRSRLKRGVLGGYSAPLIEKDRPTVGSVLQKAGYHTAAIGKWHLWMTMALLKGGKPGKDRWDGDGNVDFTKPIADSPITRGFHEYFGVSASLDMAPYVWIENDQFVKTIDNLAPVNLQIKVHFYCKTELTEVSQLNEFGDHTGIIESVTLAPLTIVVEI